MSDKPTPHGDKFRSFETTDEVMECAGQQFRFYQKLFGDREEHGHAYAAGFFANACERWKVSSEISRLRARISELERERDAPGDWRRMVL